MNWRHANIELYPKSQSPEIDLDLFANPTREYRGTPFWSWNTKLETDELLRQIECFRQMGFGGFHMHSRTGLATEYLGDEFMAAVSACVERARHGDMLAWLYDEDRWPSGAAGGIVTQDHRHRARYLLWTQTPRDTVVSREDADNRTRTDARPGDRAVLLARFAVVLDADGCLAEYRRLEDDEQPVSSSAAVWYAYVESAGDSPWHNNQAYLDTLSPAAVAKFIEVTHERYREVVGADFGGVVPAMFTDEPQFVRKEALRFAGSGDDLAVPFTTDLCETYESAYDQRLDEHLPELFWELPDGRASVVRYRYHDHVAERFAAAFADSCGRWCIDHGIALTGHMMEEPTLESQTVSLGEAMRSYRGFQLPGIDMLCDDREHTTAKQAQSAAHQYGRPGVLSELYGVTNWDFDFVGHKNQGDWQAALGVTVRVPHLAWASMAGEAKRDYPAPIDYHSPWYDQYHLVEDHFARVSVAMTWGRPLVRVGVVHPVESYWLAWGPTQQTKVEREERERDFANVTNWLLFGLVDFDYLCESLLSDLAPHQQGPAFEVGKMRYDVVLVPAMRTIRSTTLDRLEAFADAGGRVVFAGEVPSLVNAEPSGRAVELADRCERIDMRQRQVLAAVEAVREVDVRLADGEQAETVLHQIRSDEGRREVFFCNTSRDAALEGTTIMLSGLWAVTLRDTMSGRCQPLDATRRDGRTAFCWDFPAHGSLLVSLSPAEGEHVVEAAESATWIQSVRLDQPAPVSLSEPNVLLLDQAQWRLAGDSDWQPLEEILRLDNLVRDRLGLPRCTWCAPQPWANREPASLLATVELRFEVDSTIDIEDATLALEELHSTEILLDGVRVNAEPCGWFVDQAIRQIQLPKLLAGRHELVLRVAFSARTKLEWCYLLGDFGVSVGGRCARITEPVRELSFGDWCVQGLPFYAGNVTYHSKFETASGAVRLSIPKFRAPLLTVSMDGRPLGPIAFAPFSLDLGDVSPGKHALDITAYGNRFNAFGQLHSIASHCTWWGPDSWRTEGVDWAYEYQLRKAGILSAPIVQTLQK